MTEHRLPTTCEDDLLYVLKELKSNGKLHINDMVKIPLGVSMYLLTTNKLLIDRDVDGDYFYPSEDCITYLELELL